MAHSMVPYPARSASLSRGAAAVLGSIVLVLLCVLLVIPQLPQPAAAAPPQSGVKLIMIEDPGCPYCLLWTREVGTAYAASAEGRFAPLVRRYRGHPDVASFANVVYSPTFIVVREGVEIGRIVGYPGADFFWGLLGQILSRAGFRGDAGTT
jgi:hypothetical protein